MAYEHETEPSVFEPPTGIGQYVPEPHPPGTNRTRLLDERQAAKLLDVSAALLRKWRRLGFGPVYARIGRLIKYPERSIATYTSACCVEPKQ